VIAFAEFDDCIHANGSWFDAVSPSGRSARLPFRIAGDDSASSTVVSDLSWSPDGQRITYALSDLDADWNMRIGLSGIYVSTSDRSKPHRIVRPVSPHESISYPSWSPDDNWIAFVRVGGEQPGIWLVRDDGAALRRVTARGVTAAEDPAWLPPAQ
jgi:Tol biopolymer transport system component